MPDITDPIYSDPDKAREHLEALHWPDGPICPKCGETKRVTRLAGKSTRPGVVMCNACRKPFSVTVGTIMEDSKIPLNKWLLAFRLPSGGKKGFSAHELHRSLGITYKSAWFLAHRIREAMKTDPDAGPLGGADKVVEADETFVGGKERNKQDPEVVKLTNGFELHMPPSVREAIKREGIKVTARERFAQKATSVCMHLHNGIQRAKAATSKPSPET